MVQQARALKERIDGVLLLDKAEGFSSNQALQQIKRLFRAAKAGHTGTLDPFASGLLPICFGEATKFSSFALEADKRYEASVQLGVSTDTGDRDGRELQRSPVAVGDAQIEHALAGLRGEIRQTPPMYSAIKKDGKALYEYARAGIEVERAERSVTIYALELIARRTTEIDIAVTCSKGTYIRTLAEQIGAALGCGAHLSRLRRTGSGALDVTEAVTLAALLEADEARRASWLLPADALVAGLPRIDLRPAQAADILLGRAVAWSGAPAASGDAAQPLKRAYASGRFLGLVAEVAGKLRAQRLISTVSGPESQVDLEARAV